MSKEKVPRGPWKSFSAPEHSLPFDQDSRELVGGDNKTEQRKYWEPGGLEGSGQLHTDERRSVSASRWVCFVFIVGMTVRVSGWGNPRDLDQDGMKSWEEVWKCKH